MDIALKKIGKWSTSEWRYVTSLIIRRMKVKTTMRDHLTHVYYQDTENSKCFLRMGRRWSPSLRLVEMTNGTATMGNSMIDPQKMKQIYHIIQQFHSGYLPNSIESRVLRRYLYSHVHNSTTHNSQLVEAAQVSINRGMHRQQIVVWSCNGILFSLKKEGNHNTCYNVN